MKPNLGADGAAATMRSTRRSAVERQAGRSDDRVPLRGAGQGAVVVAVAAVRVVQVAADQVVDMTAVRHRMVVARAAVLVGGVVAAARM